MKYLSNKNIDKATGTHGIRRILLKLAAPHIAEHVTFVCNHSINVSVFPNKWKEAKVSPLHKSGPSEEVNKYRPFAISLVLSKVLEKHVHDCLSDFLHT